MIGLEVSHQTSTPAGYPNSAASSILIADETPTKVANVRAKPNMFVKLEIQNQSTVKVEVIISATSTSIKSDRKTNGGREIPDSGISILDLIRPRNLIRIKYVLT